MIYVLTTIGIVLVFFGALIGLPVVNWIPLGLTEMWMQSMGRTLPDSCLLTATAIGAVLFGLGIAVLKLIGVVYGIY